jgi:hypothetical protein
VDQFVLTYEKIDDPPEQEVDALVTSLKGSKILDRMPGSILVQGSRSVLSTVGERFPDWKLTKMAYGSANPPNRKIRKSL